jgi:DNA-binding transcriptional LysR family regulator
MLDLTRLRVFREVAVRGSFTKAAEALGYAQPSISHHVAQLERELHAQLFERQPRQVRLTPAGQVFLRHVQDVLVQLGDAEREVAEAVRTGGRLLRLASFTAAAATLMPAAVAAFRARRPGTELRLTEADPPVSLPALIEGEHDLALVYDYPALKAQTDPAVELEPLSLDHMAVVLSPDHPAAASDRVELADLSTTPWIAPHGSVCRDAFDLACRGAGFSPIVASETNDYLAMQGLVAAGAGAALLPRLAVAAPHRPDVVLRPLAGAVIERVTFIATRAGAYRSPLVEAFRDALRVAASTTAAPGLPLEVFDPEHAIAALSEHLAQVEGAGE